MRLGFRYLDFVLFTLDVGVFCASVQEISIEDVSLQSYIL